MYNVFKNALKSDYDLKDMLNKIAEYYIKGNISKEEKEELEEEARTNANPINSYEPLETQLNEAFERIKSLESRVSILEGNSTEEPTEEYPKFKQPTGSYDAYNTGDKVTYNGKRYICQMDGCVWNPDVYPTAWEEVKESE